MKKEKKFQVKSENPWCQLDGHSAILDIEQGQYFRLNEVGSVIWEYMETPRSLPEVVERICQDFDVSQDDATKEVTPYIDELVEKGLVRVVGDT